MVPYSGAKKKLLTSGLGLFQNYIVSVKRKNYTQNPQVFYVIKVIFYLLLIF